MPNELANQMSNEALENFGEIDTRNTGTLNLVDIVNFEKLGPEQKKVGQFLAANYDTIRNMAWGPKRDDINPDGDIRKDQLSYVNQLSSSDQSQVNDKLEADKFVCGSIGAAEGAIVGGLPALFTGFFGGIVIGPFAPVAAIGVDIAAAGGGYALGASNSASLDQQNLAAINKMGL